MWGNTTGVANSVYSNRSKILDRSVINQSSALTEHGTFGRSDRKMYPQTEKAKRRNFTSRFVENMRQGQKRVSSINQNFDDSSDSEYEYVGPGPGSYIHPSDARDSQNPTEFQYFGSLSPRFEKSDKNKFPGPGHYVEKIELPKNGEKASPFFRKERKIDTIFEQFIAPGPGPAKYNDNRTEFKSKKKYKNRKDAKVNCSHYSF